VRQVAVAAIIFSLSFPALAADSVQLANDEWPPFILEGEQQGTSERLVCEALQRAGRDCSVEVGDWNNILKQARAGEIDGIAAAWRDDDRETYLLFSEPYLTNRIIPVVRNDFDSFIKSTSDLSGLRVALVSDYAYGEDINADSHGFEAIPVKSSSEALQKVRDRLADVALIDELVARNRLESEGESGLTTLNAVLAFRSLHFAVSRQHPQAEAIIADFHRTYSLMLTDGTVNEILKVDWLATDFGQSGDVNVVMRKGISLDDLANPTDAGSVYALEDSEYQIMRQRNLDSSRVKYQVDGNTYSSLQTALNEVFGENTVCEHKEYSSEFDCSNLFKKR
jgi:polar amino acid transport system substrate-binding protein